MYLLPAQQRQQQPDYTSRQVQNDDTDCFLDRLSLLFAYEKKSNKTPPHVTATGLVRSATGTDFYVYIAKNGGPDSEGKDKKCREWLEELFRSSESQVRSEHNEYWKSLLGIWKNRINYYKNKAKEASQNWDKNLESSKEEVATYFSKFGSNFDQTEFDDEWKSTHDTLQLTERDEDHNTWMKYYNFWNSTRQYPHNRGGPLMPKTGKKEAAEQYCDAIYWLEMLAMPMSIWKSFLRFKEFKENKTVHFILLDEVQPAMQSLQKDAVRRDLQQWNKEITNTGKALGELAQLNQKQIKYLHCELQILMLFYHISITSNKSLSPHRFIGCSKLSCHLCWEMLKNYRYKTRGTHQKISGNCAFPLPRSLDGAVTTFVELKDRWSSLFREYKDGQFPMWAPQLDTVPAPTENNDFNRETAREAFRKLDIQGYHPDNYPFRKVPHINPKSGAFAKVYAALPSETRDPSLFGPAGHYALKEIIITDLKKLKMTLSEIKILRSHQHKNILMLQEAFFDHSDPRIVFLGMLPWAPGTLHDCLTSLMSPGGKHEWEQLGTPGSWLPIVVQCLEGLSYLHSMDTKHNDIKPHNILLHRIKKDNGEDGIRPIIADFNISKDNYDNSGTTEGVGTHQFKAPEQFHIGLPNTLLSDIWSLGCCFAFIFILIHAGIDELTAFWDKVMTSESSGFHKPGNLKALRKILEEDINKTQEASTVVFSRGLGTLVKSMLQEKFNARPSANDALTHMKEVEAHLSVLELGVPVFDKSYRLSPRHWNKESTWPGSVLFYEELRRLSEKRSNESNIKWDLAFLVQEETRRTRENYLVHRILVLCAIGLGICIAKAIGWIIVRVPQGAGGAQWQTAERFIPRLEL